jgi:hypothetical protein
MSLMLRHMKSAQGHEDLLSDLLVLGCFCLCACFPLANDMHLALGYCLGGEGAVARSTALASASDSTRLCSSKVPVVIHWPLVASASMHWQGHNIKFRSVHLSRLPAPVHC